MLFHIRTVNVLGVHVWDVRIIQLSGNGVHMTNGRLG